MRALSAAFVLLLGLTIHAAASATLRPVLLPDFSPPMCRRVP